MLIKRRNLLPYRFFADDFIKDFFETPISKNRVRGMETDVKEIDGKYLLDINLPGFKKENVKVSFEKGYLIVQADTSSETEEKNDNYLLKERYSGSVSRSFYLGEEINDEGIEATFNDGILSLSIPKKEVTEIESKKYIEIK